MLSVLIPVKDWNPISLIESLTAQLIKTDLPYEILISDDSSPDTSSIISTQIGMVPGVKYFTREKPLGRSANRNFLADQARFDYLLFIDGDAGIAGDDFIRNYFDHLKPDAVICGGTLYHEKKPEKPEFMLRWKYGRHREQSEASLRQKHPWKSFSTFNFLIPASVFQNIRFDESIRGYGHEDTFFGFALYQAGVKIIHLNNGLFHLGLEPSEIYLDKVRESGANLHSLYVRNLIPPDCINNIRLLKNWKRLKRFGVNGLFSACYGLSKKSMEKRLCGPNPSLLLLDFYKLGAISHID
ncbi:MAG: glycosyltransferase [Bacteroidales bacterium]|nr:glycosyltransferase [Bacteroidales bacterium]